MTASSCLPIWLVSPSGIEIAASNCVFKAETLQNNGFTNLSMAISISVRGLLLMAISPWWLVSAQRRAANLPSVESRGARAPDGGGASPRLHKRSAEDGNTPPGGSPSLAPRRWAEPQARAQRDGAAVPWSGRKRADGLTRRSALSRVSGRLWSQKQYSRVRDPYRQAGTIGPVRVAHRARPRSAGRRHSPKERNPGAVTS